MKPGAHLESAIQTAIRLRLGSEPDVVLWRNSISGASEEYDPKRGGTRTRGASGLPRGSADLVGIVLLPSGVGRFFSLETKQEGKKPKPHQAQWGALVEKLGGIYAVVHSVDEALAALERARRP